MHLSDMEGAETRLDQTAQMKSKVGAMGSVILSFSESPVRHVNKDEGWNMVFNEPIHRITSAANQPRAPQQSRYCSSIILLQVNTL